MKNNGEFSYEKNKFSSNKRRDLAEVYIYNFHSFNILKLCVLQN